MEIDSKIRNVRSDIRRLRREDIRYSNKTVVFHAAKLLIQLCNELPCSAVHAK